MAKRLFYWYIFIWLFTFIFYYLSGIIWATRFLWGVLLYFFIFYSIYWFYKTLIRKEAIGFFQFFVTYLYRITVYLSIILMAFGIFTYYQNNLNPAKMPLYTLSNGEKTIKFQAMSHIARSDFYRDVRLQIWLAKMKKYVLFYEWVKPGKKENKEIFDTAIGVEITPDLYKNFSKLYGVTQQNNNDFLNIRNSLDFNIDLDIDTIVKIYLEKYPKKKILKKNKKDWSLEFYMKEKNSPKKEKINLNNEVINKLAKLNEKQLLILRYINKSILNFIIKHDNLRNFIIEKLDMPEIFSVILDDRNKNIVKNIQSSKYKNIFITYGLMHFDGVFDLLKKQDPNWKIIKTSYSFPISKPIDLKNIF